MQKNSYKRVLAFAVVLSMLMPIGTAAADSEDDEDTSAETTSEDSEEESEDSEEEDDELAEPITDDEAIAMCELVAENDNLLLYADEENERFCMKVKSSGKCWWTSPINAEADTTPIDDDGGTMQSSQIEIAKSSIAINVGDLRQEKRTELPAAAYSSKATTVTFANEENGCAVTYNYSAYGVKLTVHYELTEDSLHVYVNTDEIIEEDNSSDEGKVLTKLILCPYMGAVSGVDENGMETEGYMIVPDGSGAVINYNNGKTNYASYQQIIYGRDYTAVPLTAPRVTEQAYMPVMATVSGTSGLVCVATEGDANVYANAQVSGQNSQAYNNCYFMFETRSSDEYYMSGSDNNKITVFEKYGIKTDTFGVEFFPIESEDGEDINYADCAEVYRNYLIEDKGLTQSTEADDADLYIDTYGAVMKEESIVGLPITVKKALTTFSQASDIVSELNNAGADSIVMDYNNWTKKSVKNTVSTKAKALGKLGDTDDLTSMNSDNLTVYGSIDNFTMDSGTWGYFIYLNTAVRVSSSYSRQSTYSLSFGVEQSGVSPALIAPNTYVKIFSQMLSSFTSEDMTNMGFGSLSTKLVSDFSKRNSSSRNDTMNTIVSGYQDAVDAGQSIIAEGANSYVLPYVSAVTDVPVYSSGFNITDEDIPFYQMVIHGYVPYSTTAINTSSDSDLTYMRALAAGSNINYDMIYESADELIDTEYDDLYYSNYSGWVEDAANQYKVAKEVLASVSDYTISNYEIDGNVMITTYSKDGADDVVIEVDTENLTVKANGTTIDLVAEGAVSEGSEN
ncbi:MAG: DUF5696 domain-containing protein [Ruminococcus sp.]|nr:DUF5696 domain-containing protein [Ruminococcus sp.]